MSVEFIVSIFLAVIFLGFVLFPLFTKQSLMQYCEKPLPFSSGISKENLLKKRDKLWQEVLNTDRKNPDKKMISELADTCLQLEKRGINNIPELKKQKIEFLKSFLVFLLSSAFGFMLIGHQNSYALSQKQIQNAEKLIPPPAIQKTTGYWVPTVSQFVITPLKNKISVYYVGMFRNTFGAKGTVIALPIPNHTTHFALLKNHNIKLLPSHHLNEIVFESDLQKGVNQIQATFEVPGKHGILEWKSGVPQTLPGTAIFLFPDERSAFQLLFPGIFSQLNLEPAHIFNFNSQFLASHVQNPYGENSPTKYHPQVIQYVGVETPNQPLPFPHFIMKGIAENRTKFWFLLSVCAFFIGILLSFFYRKLRTKDKEQMM